MTSTNLLDGNVWGEFGVDGDGIVPHSAYEYSDHLAVVVNSRKKRRHDMMGSEINSTDSDMYLTGAGAMIERSPWPGTTSGGSPASGDTESSKDLQKITSEDSKMSNHGFNSSHIDATENNFCAAGPLLGDNSAATHDNLYNYSLNYSPPTENNLSFFDNGCNDKESSDLFYGWSDIGNFEDVDKMLRSCDSTFGLEILDNEEDLCWFSSSQPTDESESAMADDCKLNKMMEDHVASALENEESLTNSESNQTGKDDSRSTVCAASALGKVSADASDTSSQKKDISMLDEQANLNKKQTKHLHHLNGKRNRYSENGMILHQSDNSGQIIDAEHKYENSTSQYYPPLAFRQPDATFSHLKHDQSSHQISVSESKAGVKPENNPNPPSTSNESYTSNQAQSLESLHGPTVDTPSVIAFEKRGTLQQGRDTRPSFPANVRNGNKPNMMVFSDSAPAQKIGHENEDRKDVAKLESSHAQESSCVTSVMDGISLEATSFCQLQRVIEQLDIRTKLCIRDSLYRLAKSAEHRHNCMNPDGGNRQENDSSSHLMTGETEKYAGFMDMETDTNPIDRSIAHLLFHRPSDSSLVSENDVLSYKSHPMIPQPNSSPSLRIEKQEETPVVAGKETEVVADN
ncbi:PREDICTED: protein LNK1 isoform X2 [Tarenaya hassleriana]|uniref:protein LNK1 isoform X2 n=1 Tax=Tarenaya hassleriana TaxID=28532 RepID=UPI00053C7BF5|nr:PREDICTED: protein LNK1 isoform X2 [Tarenaya hassleriana]